MEGEEKSIEVEGLRWKVWEEEEILREEKWRIGNEFKRMESINELKEGDLIGKGENGIGNIVKEIIERIERNWGKLGKGGIWRNGRKVDIRWIEKR